MKNVITAAALLFLVCSGVMVFIHRNVIKDWLNGKEITVPKDHCRFFGRQL